MDNPIEMDDLGLPPIRKPPYTPCMFIYFCNEVIFGILINTPFIEPARKHIEYPRRSPVICLSVSDLHLQEQLSRDHF